MLCFNHCYQSNIPYLQSLYSNQHIHIYIT